MSRFTIKIAGQSGQGVNVLGEILIKAFKRSGFYTFGYREYPSLIKGGHATYQIDVSNTEIMSSTIKVDVLLVLNRQATKWHLNEFTERGLIFHEIGNPRINKEEFELAKSKNVKFIYLPALELAEEVGGNSLTSNIVSIGVIWKSLGLNPDILVEVVKDKFKDKPKIVDIDIACAKKGLEYTISSLPPYDRRLLKPEEVTTEEKSSLHLTSNPENIFDVVPDNLHKDDYILTGNEAMSLGAINAGVRIHYAYPMTPSSPILDFLGSTEEETKMIIKQAEDEITASAMAIGSMFMGTRALTATSGGGYDLMTEHVSLAGMIENPFVCVLGQRPGPATGLPTWTAQGDLLLAINAGHGEFTKCVLAAADAEDCFYKIQEAFNIAEEFQIPVIVLTDKHLGESSYQVPEFDTEKIGIKRGIIVSHDELASLESKDRYRLTESGISKRWLPGAKAADFNAQSDEHDEEGTLTEDAQMSHKMIEKRMRKHQTLLNKLPSPTVQTNNNKLNMNLDSPNMPNHVSIISWGSNYGVIKDVMKHFADQNVQINFMNLEYLWPLKTEVIAKFLNENPETILIESNYMGQLGKVIRMETGINIKNKILKWDGRPFFYEELIKEIDKFVKK